MKMRMLGHDDRSKRTEAFPLLNPVYPVLSKQTTRVGHYGAIAERSRAELCATVGDPNDLSRFERGDRDLARDAGGRATRPSLQRSDPGPQASGSPPLAAQPATSRTTSPWPDIQAAQHRKATHMTTPVTAQPRHLLIRWAAAPFRALRHLNQELLGAGEAMARSNRFPQPRPQAGPAEAKHAQPAPMSKALTRT